MRVRLAERLSSRLASSVSPVCVECRLEASATFAQVSVTPCCRSYSCIRFQASLSMVSPRHMAEPSEPSLAMKFHPPPTRASPVSTIAWVLLSPPTSASFSMCDSSSCTLALPLSVTPLAWASPTFTSWE